MPSQTFSHSAIAPAPISDVWAVLDEPGTWEAIGGVDRVFDALIDDKGRLQGFSFETMAGGKKYVGKATPYERREGETMAWRVENSEVRGVTSVNLAPGNQGGTTITVTLEVQSAGLLSSMFFPVIAGAIGKGLPRSVEEFAAGLSR